MRWTHGLRGSTTKRNGDLWALLTLSRNISEKIREICSGEYGGTGRVRESGGEDLADAGDANPASTRKRGHVYVLRRDMTQQTRRYFHFGALVRPSTAFVSPS